MSTVDTRNPERGVTVLPSVVWPLMVLPAKAVGNKKYTDSEGARSLRPGVGSTGATPIVLDGLIGPLGDERATGAVSDAGELHERPFVKSKGQFGGEKDVA
jgi:hypothetical protein